MALKLALQIMLLVIRSWLFESSFFFLFNFSCVLILVVTVVMHSAYCTGLLLARRVLKTLEMDVEYEGNVEVLSHMRIILCSCLTY